MMLKELWIRALTVCLFTLSVCGDDCFDFTCYYEEHCNVTFNVSSGLCDGQCDTGWTGPICQKQNVALNSKVYSTVPQDSESNLGITVDGSTNQTICLQPLKLDYAVTMEFNLSSIYFIKEVQIFYNENALTTFRGFSVSVASALDAKGQHVNKTLCYKNTPDDPITSGIKTVDCNKQGLYVLVENDRDNPPYPSDYSEFTDMELCELKAYVCSRNTFGEECAGMCHCHGDDVCDAINGLCPGSERLKCVEGWSGDKCDQECHGRYGQNCVSLCSDRKCKIPSSCNSFDGFCEGGCSPGYQNVDCTAECPSGLYGESCSKDCSNGQYCENNECHHVTGECRGQCQVGWQGDRCNKVCDSGSFGQNCSQKCYCYGSDVCNPVTGLCPGTGRLKCKDGWSGERCDQDCSGMYGTSCDQFCTERSCNGVSSCNTFDGACDNGCEPGYQGTDCVQVCTPGFYGVNCGQSCSDGQYCNNNTCNHLTGDCPFGGCQPGWQGTKCDAACFLGSYGANCGLQCSDRNCVNSSSCDPISGSCANSEGCISGWTGIDCTTECSIGTYGPNCAQMCRDRKCELLSSVCDVKNGSCEGRCEDGWQGTDCTSKCDSGFYGTDCGQLCSDRNCINSSSCVHVDGACDGRCVDGFSGDDCTQACPENFYGVNCTSDCRERQCTDNSTCNTNDGECIGGCLQGYIGVDCVYLEPGAAAQTQDQGLDRVYVGLIGAICGILFCILVFIIFYCVCVTRWKRNLIIKARQNDYMYYEEIGNHPNPDASEADTNHYAEAADIVNTANRSRPLPQIVVDADENATDDNGYLRPSRETSVKYNHNSTNSTTPATQGSIPASGASDYDYPKDLPSSDKSAEELDEVSRAANNLKDRHENEYVMMNSPTTNGPEEASEGYVNPAYSTTDD